MLFCLAWLTSAAFGTAQPHVISFGKWTTIKWCAGPNEGNCLDLKVRALYVDGRARESTVGLSHEITEPPGDTAAAPGWVGQRGGWLLADRMTGHISAMALPEFDPTIRWPAGIAITPRIAASQTTARNCSPSCSRWDAVNRS